MMLIISGRTLSEVRTCPRQRDDKLLSEAPPNDETHIYHLSKYSPSSVSISRRKHKQTRSKCNQKKEKLFFPTARPDCLLLSSYSRLEVAAAAAVAVSFASKLCYCACALAPSKPASPELQLPISQHIL